MYAKYLFGPVITGLSLLCTSANNIKQCIVSVLNAFLDADTMWVYPIHVVLQLSVVLIFLPCSYYILFFGLVDCVVTSE